MSQSQPSQLPSYPAKPWPGARAGTWISHAGIQRTRLFSLRSQWYFQKQLLWDFSELAARSWEVAPSVHPKPVVPSLSRPSPGSSHRSFKLFIKQSSSRRPYLVLSSAKTVLKSKAKKNFEKVRQVTTIPFPVSADLPSEVLTPPLTLCPGYGVCTQAETCYWACPKQLRGWQAFSGHHSGLTGRMEDRVLKSQKMASQCFIFIKHLIIIFFQHDRTQV